jgi:hypothetical protein
MWCRLTHAERRAKRTMDDPRRSAVRSCPDAVGNPDTPNAGDTGRDFPTDFSHTPDQATTLHGRTYKAEPARVDR